MAMGACTSGPAPFQLAQRRVSGIVFGSVSWGATQGVLSRSASQPHLPLGLSSAWTLLARGQMDPFRDQTPMKMQTWLLVPDGLVALFPTFPQPSSCPPVSASAAWAGVPESMLAIRSPAPAMRNWKLILAFFSFPPPPPHGLHTHLYCHGNPSPPELPVQTSSFLVLGPRVRLRPSSSVKFRPRDVASQSQPSKVRAFLPALGSPCSSAAS